MASLARSSTRTTAIWSIELGVSPERAHYLAPLALFAISTTFPPGGATTLAAASGARFRLRQSVPADHRHGGRPGGAGCRCGAWVGTIAPGGADIRTGERLRFVRPTPCAASTPAHDNAPPERLGETGCGRANLSTVPTVWNWWHASKQRDRPRVCAPATAATRTRLDPLPDGPCTGALRSPPTACASISTVLGVENRAFAMRGSDAAQDVPAFLRNRDSSLERKLTTHPWAEHDDKASNSQ